MHLCKIIQYTRAYLANAISGSESNHLRFESGLQQIQTTITIRI